MSIAHKFVGVALVFGLAVLAASARAQAADDAAGFPNRAVHLIVPFAAGSQTDILARILAEQLNVVWGQPVVVENRSGIPGTAAVAHAPPDGYTIMLSSNGHTVLGAINESLPFDPVKDFAGITFLATFPVVLLVGNDVRAQNVGEFIAQAKRNPGSVNFASHGLGSTLYMAAVLFSQAAKIDVVHVPYKGAPEALTGLMRNDVQFYFGGPNVATALVEAGKLRALALSGHERIPAMPNVPTIAESGLPGFSYEIWLGLLAPAGTPTSVKLKIAQDVKRVLSNAETQKKITSNGVTVATNTPDEFDALIRSETKLSTELLKKIASAK